MRAPGLRRLVLRGFGVARAVPKRGARSTFLKHLGLVTLGRRNFGARRIFRKGRAAELLGVGKVGCHPGSGPRRVLEQAEPCASGAASRLSSGAAGETREGLAVQLDRAASVDRG